MRDRYAAKGGEQDEAWPCMQSGVVAITPTEHQTNPCPPDIAAAHGPTPEDLCPTHMCTHNDCSSLRWVLHAAPSHALPAGAVCTCTSANPTQPHATATQGHVHTTHALPTPSAALAATAAFTGGPDPHHFLHVASRHPSNPRTCLALLACWTQPSPLLLPCPSFRFAAACSPPAFLLFVLTYGAALYFGFFTQQLNLGWLHDNFVPLLTASLIFSSALSLYLYVSSFKRGAMLSSHGDTGYAPHTACALLRRLQARVPSLARTHTHTQTCMHLGAMKWVSVWIGAMDGGEMIWDAGAARVGIGHGRGLPRRGPGAGGPCRKGVPDAPSLPKTAAPLYN